MGSNWKAKPAYWGSHSKQPGHAGVDGFGELVRDTRSSPRQPHGNPEHERPLAMIDSDDRGSPSGASTSSSSLNSYLRHQDHTHPGAGLPTSSPTDRRDPLSPEGGVSVEMQRNDTKHVRSGEVGSKQTGMAGQLAGIAPSSPSSSSPASSSPASSRFQQGRSSLASVSYNYHPRGSNEGGGEGGEWRVGAAAGQVAVRVTHFNQNGNNSGGARGGQEGEGGEGGRKREAQGGREDASSRKLMGIQGKEKTPSPQMHQAPQMDMCAVEISPGSSEEELSTINREEEVEKEEEEAEGEREGEGQEREAVDGGFISHVMPKSDAYGAGRMAVSGYPQVSQPLYAQKQSPTSHPSYQHQPPGPSGGNYVSLSQPHPLHGYDSPSTAHSHPPSEIPFATHVPLYTRGGVPYDHPAKHHPVQPPTHHQKHPSHQTFAYLNQGPSMSPLEYHSRSHDHHMTGHPGSHDPHMTASYGVESHRRHYPTYQQQVGKRMEPPIAKQSLIRAHDAAASGDVATLVRNERRSGRGGGREGKEREGGRERGEGVGGGEGERGRSGRGGGREGKEWEGGGREGKERDTLRLVKP